MSTNLNNGNTHTPRAWSVQQLSAASTLSEPYLRKRIASGDLKVVRAGRRVLIPDTEARRVLGLSDETAQSAAAA